MPPFHLRVTLIAATLLALAATPLMAQQPEPSDPDSPAYEQPPPQDQGPGGAPQGQPPREKHGHAHLQERFDRANVTHDGRLTIEQARGTMPKVAEHFDQVDLDHKGYATFDDVAAYHRKMSSARHARNAGDAPPPS